jgi:DNA-binding CsgD family transcriptional regulator
MTPTPPSRRLSPRQRQIVKLAAAGKTNKEIAAILSISKGTVKNHMTRIFDRLGAVSRTQAAIFCQ